MPDPNAIGVRRPVIDDPPNLPVIIGNAVEDLSTMVIPPFGTTTDRDAQYAEIPFKFCTISDVLYMRRGTTWVSMLAAPDINTPWLAPTMANGWAQLGTNPVKYRISGGMLQLDGSALYNLDGATTMPANVGMLALPSNALPSNIANFQTYAHGQAIYATGLTNNVYAPGLVNLRSNGSLVVTLPGGMVTGVRCVPLGGVQWRLTT